MPPPPQKKDFYFNLQHIYYVKIKKTCNFAGLFFQTALNVCKELLCFHRS